MKNILILIISNILLSVPIHALELKCVKNSFNRNFTLEVDGAAYNIDDEFLSECKEMIKRINDSNKSTRIACGCSIPAIISNDVTLSCLMVGEDNTVTEIMPMIFATEVSGDVLVDIAQNNRKRCYQQRRKVYAEAPGS